MAYEFIYSKKKMLLEGYRRTVGNGIKGDNKLLFCLKVMAVHVPSCERTYAAAVKPWHETTTY